MRSGPGACKRFPRVPETSKGGIWDIPEPWRQHRSHREPRGSGMQDAGCEAGCGMQSGMQGAPRSPPLSVPSLRTCSQGLCRAGVDVRLQAPSSQDEACKGP